MQATVYGDGPHATLGHLQRQELGAGGEPKIEEIKGEDKDVNFKMNYVPARKHAGQDALSRNPVCRDGLMGDMHTKEARLAVLAGIKVSEDAIEEEDPSVEMVGGMLSCYVCLMLASHTGVKETPRGGFS